MTRQPSGEVHRIKYAVRGRDGWKCTKCGMTNAEHLELYGRQLDVHRIEPGSLYTEDGCVTLCKTCHGTEPKRPVGTADRSGCNSGFFVRLTPESRTMLERLVARSGRTMVGELCLALDRHYRDEGVV